jgi:alkylation response protein AidB-like acyl-CoA dehydrogenase
MTGYTAPTDQIVRTLRVAGIEDVLALDEFKEIDLAAITDVVEGFGTLASEVIAPTDRIGDTVGATLDPATATVKVADEVANAFAQYVEGGWTSLAASARHGGGGFPRAVGIAVHEMLGSANLALGLNPMLSTGAIELLELWGSPEQQELFLPRMIGGQWTGTMLLTEPDAGSDLGAVRTMARPDGDRWRISGTKIFITWGEHDLTENIVHLVLARTPDAPAGVKGISLFVVPKFDVAPDGSLGARNGVRCVGVEHKLGIHSSPTCVMELDGAVGDLVGPLHGGMPAMFSMMNAARLAVGVQGISVGEAALQKALVYARERVQGKRPGSTEPARLIDHPDVERMLLDIASSVDAMRLLTAATAVSTDIARHHPDPGVAARHKRRVEVLTPLAKAWPTDEGVRLTSLAIQVHGGMGYVEETGVAQHFRDARIAPIYEGTNGIQALDLVGRKVGRDGGVAAGELLDDVAVSAAHAGEHKELAAAAGSLTEALASARQATEWVVRQTSVEPESVLAGACAYLELMAVTAAGALLLDMARQDLVDGSPLATQSAARAGFFAVQHLDRRPTLSAVMLGTASFRDGLPA